MSQQVADNHLLGRHSRFQLSRDTSGDSLIKRSFRASPSMSLVRAQVVRAGTCSSVPPVRDGGKASPRGFFDVVPAKKMLGGLGPR